MVGNVPEMYDPANAGDRKNQYPHSITSNSTKAQPSILARDLVIPLHFWFCEDIGSALPLVALQYSEVEIVVEFASIYDLFTVRDVRDSSVSEFGLNNIEGSIRTFGQRIRADPGFFEFNFNTFLSPPLLDGTPENPSLVTWSLNPYIEANYIFIGDAEMVQVAKSDNSFKIKECRVVTVPGVYGAGNDIELVLVNLCTRVVWTAQRSDAARKNDVDNYTNQLKVPYGIYQNLYTMTPWYSSGAAVGQSLSANDILIDGVVVFDGAERFNTKTYDFFKYLENYRHHAGSILPGIYTYSFALEHDTQQPSGHVNGSMFNKTILRLTVQDPPISNNQQVLPGCILKSTALNALPVQVSSGSPGDIPGQGLRPDQVISVITKPADSVRPYTYTVTVYVESYNFLRVTRGIANVVFSS